MILSRAFRKLSKQRLMKALAPELYSATFLVRPAQGDPKVQVPSNSLRADLSALSLDKHRVSLKD